MLHWGVQCENRKKNTSAQKHIYHKHNFATGGNISSSGKQPSGPVPFIPAPVADLLCQPSGTKRPEAVGRGRGVMSVIGEGARESHCSALPRIVIQHGLGRGRLVRGSQKR